MLSVYAIDPYRIVLRKNAQPPINSIPGFETA